MADKAKELLEKVKEWWNKFTSKQKTIIIGTAAVIILAFAILFTVLSQTKYVVLKNCETQKEASEIVDLLETAGVAYQVSDDGLRIQVDAKEESTANLLLGANGFTSSKLKSFGSNNVIFNDCVLTGVKCFKLSIIMLKKE